MDDNLKKGITGVSIGVIGIVGFALTVGGPFNNVEGLYEYQDGPALIPYALSVGFLIFGLYNLYQYSQP